jgi:hypothetical protein
MSALGHDIEKRSADVRFTPESGHRNSVVEGPLCAKSGLMHCSINCNDERTCD